MHKLSISEKAKLDIFEAFLWYEEQRDGLGFRFEVSIEAALAKLIQNPLLFQVRYEDIRVHFIERFPYGIHYLIEPDEIKVVGVFHASRDPKDWTDR
jgi:toxin ParE1/3/4